MIGNYNFKPQVAGDTFDGISLTITEDGTPIDLTTVSEIKIVFIRRNTSSAASTLTDGSGITIDDAAAGEFSIDPFTVWTTAGEYDYDLQFTYTGGDVKTYLKGTMEVYVQVTT